MAWGTEKLPHHDWHPDMGRAHKAGSYLRVVLSPTPRPEGYADDEPVAIRVVTVQTGLRRWLARGDQAADVVVVGADDSGVRRPRFEAPDGPVPVTLGRGAGPRPTGRAADDQLETYASADLRPAIRTGRNFVLASIDGRIDAFIPFRVLRPGDEPDPARSLRRVLPEEDRTALSIAIEPAAAADGRRRAGEPVVLRGGGRLGVNSMWRARHEGEDPMRQVLLLLFRYAEPWASDGPPRPERPAPGEWVPSGFIQHARLSALTAPRPKVTVTADAHGRDVADFTFAVDLSVLADAPVPASAAGRYWVALTADGQMTKLLHFEVA